MHGEKNESNERKNTKEIVYPKNPIDLLPNDVFGGSMHRNTSEGPSRIAGEEERIVEDVGVESTDFFYLIKDGVKNCMKGPNALEFLLKLYHIKCLSRMTNKV